MNFGIFLADLNLTFPESISWHPGVLIQQISFAEAMAEIFGIMWR
jgi:hypothetical protein